jgi:hypothetical protein
MKESSDGEEEEVGDEEGGNAVCRQEPIVLNFFSPSLTKKTIKLERLSLESLSSRV